MATVPAPAASWIVQYLRNADTGRVYDWMERVLITGNGLNALIVRQLKVIWNAVEPHTIVRKPANHAKKAVWVERIRRVFFNNDDCTLENTEILSQLPTGSGGGNAQSASVQTSYSVVSQQNTAQSIGAAQAHSGLVNAVNAAAAVTAIQRAQASRPQAQLAQRGPQALTGQPQTSSTAASRGPQTLARRPQTTNTGPKSLDRGANATAMQRPNAAAAAAASRQAQNLAFQQAMAAFSPHGSIMWMPASFQVPMPSHHHAAQMPPPHHVAVSTTPTSSTSQHPNKKIKKEPGVAARSVLDEDNEDDSRARTNLENEMVIQLRQMGFTDMREILTGIRHVLNTPADVSSQVESAMMWIVAQREESEEARKIDAARARSESLRAEQARLQKQAAHERLWGTSMDDWLSQSDLFRGSVVLKEARECLETAIFDKQEYKEKLIRFLELEKKAWKWYGICVPWCFFCQLCEQWKKLSTDELVQSIEKESTRLETAMYSLSEQEGGVPKIFREARSNAEKTGRPVSPTKEGVSVDDDDDDIVIVKEVYAAQANARMDTVSSNGKKCEVIDLL